MWYKFYLISNFSRNSVVNIKISKNILQFSSISGNISNFLNKKNINIVNCFGMVFFLEKTHLKNKFIIRKIWKLLEKNFFLTVSLKTLSTDVLEFVLEECYKHLSSL